MSCCSFSRGGIAVAFLLIHLRRRHTSRTFPIPSEKEHQELISPPLDLLTKDPIDWPNTAIIDRSPPLTVRKPRRKRSSVASQVTPRTLVSTATSLSPIPTEEKATMAPKLPSLSHPKLLYFTRILQLLLAIAFLILICYCGTHRGWWTNINGPLAVGGTSLLLSLSPTLSLLSTPPPPSLPPIYPNPQANAAQSSPP